MIKRQRERERMIHARAHSQFEAVDGKLTIEMAGPATVLVSVMLAVAVVWTRYDRLVE